MFYFFLTETQLNCLFVLQENDHLLTLKTSPTIVRTVTGVISDTCHYWTLKLPYHESLGVSAGLHSADNDCCVKQKQTVLFPPPSMHAQPLLFCFLNAEPKRLRSHKRRKSTLIFPSHTQPFHSSLAISVP